MKRKKIAAFLLAAAMTAESVCPLYAEEVSSVSAESSYETDLADSSDAQAVDVDDFSTVDVADEISASGIENDGNVSTAAGDDTAAGEILEGGVTQSDISSEDLFDEIVISEDEAYIDPEQDAEEPDDANTGTTNAEGENISADGQGDSTEDDSLVDYVDTEGVEAGNQENAADSGAEAEGISLPAEDISVEASEEIAEEDISEDSVSLADVDSDSLEKAQVITLNTDGTYAGEASITTQGEHVYYQFTPEEDGNYQIISSASDEYDPVCALYDNSGNQIAYSDNAEYRNFKLVYRLEKGSKYYFGIYLLGSDTGSTGKIPFKFSRIEAGNIALSDLASLLRIQVSNATLLSDNNYSVEPNREITLSIANKYSSDTSDYLVGHNYTYTWYTSNESGQVASGTSMTITPGRNNTYRCEISDNTDSCNVSTYIQIDNQLKVYPKEGSDKYSTESVFVSFKGQATLTPYVIATNKDGLKYEWFCNGAALETDNSGSYTTGEITKAVSYECRVTDAYGNTESAYYRVSVDNELKVVAEEGENSNYKSIAVTFKDSVTLTPYVTANNLDGLSYEWRSWSDNTTLGTEASYTINSVEKTSDYDCTVTDCYGYSQNVTYHVYVDNQLEVYAKEGSGGNTETVLVEQNGSTTLKPFVIANNKDGLKYKWSCNGISLVTDNSDSYTTGAITKRASYQCNVTDVYGNTAFAYYIVSVDNKLKVVTEEGGNSSYLSVPVTLKSSVTLTAYATAEDLTGLSYEWRSGSDNTTLGTEASYTINSVEKTSNYYCTVTDRYGYSVNATYHVSVDNQLKVYPKEGGVRYSTELILVSPKEKTTLTPYVTATNKDGLKYEWFRDGVSLETDNSGSYTTDAVTRAANYECCVTDAYGNTEYAHYRVSVDNQLKVYSKEGGVRYSTELVLVSLNEKTTLTPYVTATNTDGLKYEWFRDGVSLETDNSGSYTTDAVTRAVSYECRVTDAYGNTESAYYRVSVDNELKVVAEEGENSSYKSIAVTLKDSVTLAPYVTAKDSTGLSYEWRSRPDNTTLGTEASYTINSVEKTSDYYCTVTDRYGYSQSVTYHVSVDNQLKVYADKENQSRWKTLSVSPSNTTTLTPYVTATNTDGLKYEWFCEGVALEETSGSYTPNAITRATNYQCNVTDAYGNTGYAYYSVYVDNQLKVYADDENKSSWKTVSVSPNETTTLTPYVSATNKEGLKYEWRCDGAVLEETSGSYTTGAITKPTNYQCRVMDTYGNTGYAYFYVTVNNNFSVSAEKTPISVKPEEHATLKAIAAGENLEGVTYQWNKRVLYYGDEGEYYDYEKIDGETGSSLTIENVPNSFYRVDATDQYGNTDSAYFSVVIDNNFDAWSVGSTNVYVVEGGSAAFKVAASADYGNITFEWRGWNSQTEEYDVLTADDVVTTEARESTLKISNCSQEAEYSCTVSDQYGNSRRFWFTVYLTDELKLNGETNVTVTPDQEYALLSVEAVTSDQKTPVTYQWYAEDEMIKGETGSSYHAPVQNGSYRCKAWQGNMDEPAELEIQVCVDSGLAISPDEETISLEKEDDIAFMNVTASSKYSEKVTYTWYENPQDSGDEDDWIPIDNDKPEYSVKPGKDTTYICRVSDGYMTCYACFYITYNSNLQYSPESRTIRSKEGNKEELAVSASTGMGDLSYQWYSENYDGNRTLLTETSATYSATTGEKPARYVCVVSNGYTSGESCFYVYPETESAETVENATSYEGALSLSVNEHHNVEYGASYDYQEIYFSVKPEKSGDYTFYSAGYTNIDASVIERTDDTEEAVTVADYGTGNVSYDHSGNFHLTCYLEAGKTYYLRVQSWYRGISGIYMEAASTHVHTYGPVAYSWSEDHTTMTASRICKADEYQETETVHARTSVIQAATCTTGGKKEYAAYFDNDAFDTQYYTMETAALGHDYGAPAYVWSADNSTVTATRVCSRNASHVETETARTTSSVSRAATCTARGTTTYTAAFVNPAFSAQTKTVENINALGHNPVTDPAVAATCLAAGKTAGSHCSRCGAVLKAQETINATGHRIVIDAAVAPTTTSEGKTQGSHCSVCGTVITAQVSIPKLSVEGDVNDKTSVAAAAKAVTSLKKQSAEVAGAKFTDFKLQIAKSAKTSLKIKWSKYSGADGYIIFGSKCGKAMKQLATVGAKTTSYTQKGLKKGTAYKYIVSAYKTNADGTRHVLATSLSVHGSTTNGKKTTINKVTASGKKKITLKKGKSTTLKVKLTGLTKGLKILQHRKVTFISSNPSVASVSAKSGKVKAKKAGKCTIYAYSDSGKYVKFTITVKKK